MWTTFEQGGVTFLVFQHLGKFGMLPYACFLCNVFHSIFLVNWTEAMLEFVVEKHKEGVEVVDPKRNFTVFISPEIN